jgi:23S rRNA (adenine2503-C2)-methyltransferase
MQSLYDIPSMEALCRDLYRRRAFLNAVCKQALPQAECLALLPEAGEWAVPSLELVERHDSAIDGATKLLFRTRDKQRIEAVVLRISSGRTSLCISSQVGCAAGCQFCATGAMGFVRNLSAPEMLDQVLLAKRLLRGEGRRLRNVVVMGMGEPLHNEAHLYSCLDILRDPRYFNLSVNHLLVSTVGVSDAMARFGARFPDIRLALSLHSARQEVREQLMPIGKVETVAKLKAVLPMLGGTMIEYLLLKGINDGAEDLAALKEFVHGTHAHINLIQFNAHPGSAFEAVTEAARKAFADELKGAGYKVTSRYSLGNDIAAACGQLAGG